MPKVFISYSHDTTEHKKWVLQVSDQLRSDGLECQIDQYVHGFPAEGWPSWMEKQIEHADFVLIVCSELYLQRFRREDPDGGRGVAFEGVIITQTLYDHHCHNKKFIPVIPLDGNLEHVPIFLKGFTAYNLPSDYTSLYRLLTNQPAVVPMSVGSIKVLPPENAAASNEAPHQPETVVQASTPVASYDPRNSEFLVPFYEKGAHMVGREQALEEVRKQLLQGRPASIGQAAVFQGMGGLGKTQLAVEYAYQYREAYPNGVYWITADGNIDAQLTKIAVDAGWVAPESEHSIKLDIARHRIKSYSECLIVFDNLETVDAIRDYLPEPPARPHILVTSRGEQPEFTPVKLDPLDNEQSYAMLVQEAGRPPENDKEETAAREIATALGGLPLALELAGAYLAHRQAISWCAYRDMLQENLQRALPSKFSSLTDHDADLFKTLSISEKEIGEEPLLAKVLDLLTWSGASPMGLPLMAHLLDVKPVELHNALGLGVALRLLQQEKDSERYAIHRLVQEVRRQNRPLDQQDDWAKNIVQHMGNWFEAIRKDFHELPTYESEIEHLQAWQTHSKASPIDSVRLLWLQAYPAYHRGRYVEALHIVKQALSTYGELRLVPSELEAHLLNDLASCYSNMGNFPRALELGQQALEMQRNLFGEQHPTIAQSLSNLASNYSSLGNPQRALELGQQALEMRRNLFGEQHPAIAQSLSNLSRYYSNLGNLQRAFELNQQALEIRRNLFGEQHPDIAISLGNMAADYSKSDSPQHALDLGSQALEMRHKLFGKQHPDIANSLGNLAHYHAELGNPQHALELGQQALEMRHKFFGEQHPDIALSLANLAGYYAELGNPQHALELGRQALEMRRKLLGIGHPDTVYSLKFLAKRLYTNPHTASRGKLLVEEYLRHIPRDHSAHQEMLKFLGSQKGFRKPGQGKHGRKQRKKR